MKKTCLRLVASVHVAAHLHVFAHVPVSAPVGGSVNVDPRLLGPYHPRPRGIAPRARFRRRSLLGRSCNSLLRVLRELRVVWVWVLDRRYRKRRYWSYTHGPWCCRWHDKYPWSGSSRHRYRGTGTQGQSSSCCCRGCRRRCSRRWGLRGYNGSGCRGLRGWSYRGDRHGCRSCALRRHGRMRGCAWRSRRSWGDSRSSNGRWRLRRGGRCGWGR